MTRTLEDYQRARVEAAAQALTDFVMGKGMALEEATEALKAADAVPRPDEGAMVDTLVNSVDIATAFITYREDRHRGVDSLRQLIISILTPIRPYLAGNHFRDSTNMDHNEALELAESMLAFLKPPELEDKSGYTLQQMNVGYVQLTSKQASIIAHAVLQSEEQSGEGWQDISTAPRDGSWFIICRAGEEYFYEVGCYKPLLGSRFVEMGDGLFRKEEVSHYDWEGFNNFHRATHWQPLPAPPTAHEAEGE